MKESGYYYRSEADVPVVATPVSMEAVACRSHHSHPASVIVLGLPIDASLVN
ncbi:MAG: hypothetical protein ACLR8Y_13160 [Alistipes indistinctus]